TTNYFATGTNTLTGCVNTNTITLAVYISTFTAISGTAICKGETVTLTASGAAPNYSWTGGIMSSSIAVSPLINTTYYVTGLNVSCSNTQAITVTVNPLPNVTASVAKSQICKFEVATITGNGASTYSWNTGAATQVLTFTLGITTTYTLTGTDNNGCSKTTTVTQFVATCIGLDEEVGKGRGLNIYPNPNNGEFTIMLNDKNERTMEIMDVTGRIILAQTISGDEVKVMMNSFANGIYYVSVKTNISREVFKIIKE
ncbi:MAG: T9SS type A sorting domain-containing protein, partial [Bacteroidota bacterium]